MNKRKIIASAATGILGLGLVIATPAFAMAAPAAPTSVATVAWANTPATPTLFDQVDRFGHYSFFSVRTSEAGPVVVRNAAGEQLYRYKAPAGAIVFIGLNHDTETTVSVTLQPSFNRESAPLQVVLPTPEAALAAMLR
jgi:hypothetical protein